MVLRPVSAHLLLGRTGLPLLFLPRQGAADLPGKVGGGGREAGIEPIGSQTPAETSVYTTFAPKLRLFTTRDITDRA